MTASQLQPLPPGTTLARGKYVLDRVLGQGGFGFVYLARDQQGQPLAIKQCMDLSSEGLMQFGHEVAIQKILSDETFVRVFAQFVENLAQNGAQTTAESLFTVMEYVPGRTLEELLDERLQRNLCPFAEQDAVAWMIQILGSLHHAHAVNVIHRDIKPGNILLAPDGRRVKVIDFGIAKIGGNGAQTLQGARGVSPGYSPPEQYSQAGKTDTVSDIYAVGATLYHLLTGSAPVDAPVRQSGQLLIPPRQHNPQISPLVEAVILRAMQLDVADRFQTALEMQAALQGKPAPSPLKTQSISDGSSTATIRGSHSPVSPPQVTVAPQLTVTPAQIDWGAVTRQPPPRELYVGNLGAGQLQVSIESSVSWLQITPSSLTVCPQAQQRVAVELAPDRIAVHGQQRGAIQFTAADLDPRLVSVTVHIPHRITLSAAPGKQLSSLSELVKWCDSHWPEAIRLLRNGELHAAIQHLCKPVAGRFSPRPAELTNVILGKIQQASALPNDNLALETVLRALGAKPPRFRHNWRTIERQLGMGWRPDLRWFWPWWSGPGPMTFVIQNRGRGYLYGRVDRAVAWLEISQPEFGCLAGQKQRIEIRLKQRQRRLRGVAPEILVLQVH